MLQRSTQVGEFYRMSPPAVWDSSQRLPSSYMGKPRNNALSLPCTALDCVQYTILTTPLLFPFADIMIYDEESDRHIHIPFQQALWATTYGDARGPRGDLFKLTALTPDVVEKCNKSSAVMKTFGGGADAVAFQGGLDDGTNGFGTWLSDGTRDYTDDAVILAVINQIILAVKAGVWVPVEIVIARPFIEHLMLSAIVTVSGRDTGATLFGPADMCATWNSNPNSSSMPPRSQI